MTDPLAEQEQVDMASINAFVIMDGEKSGDNPTNGRHLWKSDILSKDAGHRPASLLKISLFHRCFLHILLVKPNTWFFHKWNIGLKWVFTVPCNFCNFS